MSAIIADEGTHEASDGRGEDASPTVRDMGRMAAALGLTLAQFMIEFPALPD